MGQGDLFRVLTSLATAGAGAALALGGAAVTGQLGRGSTTIEEIADPASPGTPASFATAGGLLSVEQIYRLDSPGVVEVTATSVRSKADPQGVVRAASKTTLTHGSGFVIDKAGHIVTNNHVIAGARRVQVSFSGADELDAEIVGKDPSTDVALLQVNAHSRSLTPLPLGNSDNVQVGDSVVAIGNPLDLARTATSGIVSSVQRSIDAPDTTSTIEHAIQTDAAINHGNSGGPLIDSSGSVIGVNAQVATGNGGGVGIGFAIPINTVKSVVAQLIRNGKVEHVFLGVDAAPVTESLARTFALPVTRGLLVQAVSRGSSAARAGLRAGKTSVVVAGESYRIGGDIIVAVDRVRVTSQEQLRDVLETLKPGDRLTLEIRRGHSKRTVHVTLGQPPG